MLPLAADREWQHPFLQSGTPITSLEKKEENMERFEYKTLFTDAKGALGGKVDPYALEKDLNQLGAQGWELVSSVPAAQSHLFLVCSW